MTRFDAYCKLIMEEKSPEQHTQDVMMKYGKKLRDLRDKLMNCSNLDKTYQSYRAGFAGVADDFLKFYENRKNEIESSDTLSSILEVILKMITDTDPRFKG